ncbi:MAG TPA: hypothetical protein VHG71_06550 [Verrucomicrobiae bacterium]|nr:hypothetical protein [Verrucomicrobiae bacterium]
MKIINWILDRMFNEPEDREEKFREGIREEYKRSGFESGIEFCKGDWNGVEWLDYLISENMIIEFVAFKDGMEQGIRRYTAGLKGGAL